MNARRRRGPARRKPHKRGILAVAGWFTLFIGVLWFVTWRQTRAVDMERTLRHLETERAAADAERVGSLRRIEELRGRARVVRVAQSRLGMHLPADSEIVFLPAVASSVGEGMLAAEGGGLLGRFRVGGESVEPTPLRTIGGEP
jgi:hypothetical protein